MLRRGAAVAAAMALGLSLSSSPARAQDSLRAVARDAVTMTPRQQVSFAEETLVELDAALEQLQELLAEATAREDTEQIQCVKLKQVAVRALRDVSARADSAMRGALASGAEDRAAHELRKIAVARTKVRQLVAEAQACMGQPATLASTLDVDVDGLEAEGFDDETEEPEADCIVCESGVDASQFE